jgi:hypothetical protein
MKCQCRFLNNPIERNQEIIWLNPDHNKALLAHPATNLPYTMD